MAICLLLVVLFALTGFTEGDVKDACTSAAPCDPDTTICDNLVCKTKADLTCSATDECVLHASCPGTQKKCTCDDGYTASSDFCKLKVGGTCTADDECVSKSSCSNKKCACDNGYTEASGLCSPNGGARQSVSSWLLTGSIISFLVTLSLP